MSDTSSEVFVNTVLSVSKSPLSTKLVCAMPLVGLLLAGCISSKYAPKERALENPAELGLSAAAAPVAAPEWWTAYQDSQLDRLMRDAQAGNPTLAQSLARLRLAQAEASAIRADSLPQVTYDATESRKHLTVLLLIPLCWIACRPAGGAAAVGGE